MKRILLLISVFLIFLEVQGQEGQPDSSFGTNGFVRLVTNYSASSFQSDGKLVVAQNITGGFTLTRYNTNGTLDEGFGSGGTVTTLIPYMTETRAVLIAIQNNDNIAVQVEGSSSFVTPFWSNYKTIGLARFSSNGVLDATFGTGGILSQNIQVATGILYPEAVPYIHSLAVLNDGKIVSAMNYNLYRQTYAGVTIYNTDGTSAPASKIQFDQYTYITAFAIGPDGSMVLAGASEATFPRNHKPFLLSINSNVKSDVFFTAGSDITYLAVQQDGKIIGSFSNKLFRLNTDGTLDNTFGDNGIVSTGFEVNKIIIQRNDKIIIGSVNDFTIGRYNSNGTLDIAFGNGGTITSSFGTNARVANLGISGSRLYAFGNGILAAYKLVIACTQPAFLNNGQIVRNAGCSNNDGNITIQPTIGASPFMYSIDGGVNYVPGANTAYTFGNLAAATYRLRLKDANGCESDVVERTVGLDCASACTPPTFLNNGQIIKDAGCSNDDGNITIEPTSGVAPFMYSINGGTTYIAGPSSGFTFSNLSAGNYSLRLKDANGCESAVVEKTVKLVCTTTCTPPVFLNNGLIVLDASCGNSDGSLSIIPTSGTAPFMYSKDGGITYVAGADAGYTFANLAAGTYQLRLKDTRGCEAAVVDRIVKNYYNCSSVTSSSAVVAGSDVHGVPFAPEKDLITTYPNPSKGHFKVFLQNFAAPKAEVLLMDVKGSIIQKRSLNLNQSTIADFDLYGKARGLYYIKVVSSIGTKFSKIVIQ